jgi:hypothetical protein
MLIFCAFCSSGTPEQQSANNLRRRRSILPRGPIHWKYPDLPAASVLTISLPQVTTRGEAADFSWVRGAPKRPRGRRSSAACDHTRHRGPRPDCAQMKPPALGLFSTASTSRLGHLINIVRVGLSSREIRGGVSTVTESLGLGAHQMFEKQPAEYGKQSIGKQARYCRALPSILWNPEYVQ